ncbi:MAG: hypothetical protein CL790_04360, partial [Chloroflexi bacterium]|nr:hypothetical protein [Chloroflexota bacterium]
FEVGIAGVHVMGIGDVVEGLLVEIAERDEFGGVGVGVGIGVDATDATSDDSCAQRGFRTHGAASKGSNGWFGTEDCS